MSNSGGQTDASKGPLREESEPEPGSERVESKPSSSTPSDQQDGASFRQIMDAIADGVSIVSPEFDLLYANPVIIRDFGEYEGRKCYEYYLDREEPCPWCNNERVFQGDTVRYNWESKKSGRAYELVDSPLTNPDGSVAKLEIFRDITERQRLEEQLRQSQKLEAVGRLAGGVAHDFNNVLAVIITNARFAHDAIPEDHPAQEDIQEIGHAAKRAAELVRQLLAFSRRQVLRPDILDLNTIVTGIQKMLRRLIGEDISLVTHLTPELDPVRADPGQMEQVLANLALNARDAMPEGGTLVIRTANVDLERALSGPTQPKPRGPGVVLIVEDDGEGMDPETLQRAFEPFFTTKDVGEGSGLGLASVYGIVKQSGGELKAHSAVGRGSRIEVYLPSHLPETQAATEDEPPAAEPVDEPSATTVLVVEDEDSVRRAASRILRRRGFTVLEASSGEQALQVSEQHAGPIRLLLTDVVMPGMNGAETYLQLREQRVELAVLYMSGYPDEVMSRHGVKGPLAPFIDKPFTAEGLIGKVRSVLTERAPARAT